MESFEFKKIIERAQKSSNPKIEFVRRSITEGQRLGVFAASFNPVTMAHVELIHYASTQFSLNETLALVGAANADKSAYECSLEDRLAMLLLAFEADKQMSIGLSSHAYFVDMVEAIEMIYPPEIEINFIIGFDTLERLLDREDKYTTKYHRKFTGRIQSLDFLFERSRLIVAGRSKSGRDSIDALIESEIPQHASRVLFLDTPLDLAERSASDVRERARSGLSISGLVPIAVERYVIEREIYQTKVADYE